MPQSILYDTAMRAGGAGCSDLGELSASSLCLELLVHPLVLVFL